VFRYEFAVSILADTPARRFQFPCTRHSSDFVVMQPVTGFVDTAEHACIPIEFRMFAPYTIEKNLRKIKCSLSVFCK
jgi:hypothetical protein